MLLGVTVHWAEVYRRILGEHFASGAGTQGTKQQEIAHSNCCYWRVCGVPTQSAKVLSTLEGLPSISRTGF